MQEDLKVTRLLQYCPHCGEPFNEPLPNGYILCGNCDCCGYAEIIHVKPDSR